MKRRSLFGALLAAPVALTASPVKPPASDVVYDFREMSDADCDALDAHRLLVNGADVKLVWYINLTKGFVRTYDVFGDGLWHRAKTGFTYLDPIPMWSQRATDGHCWIYKHDKFSAYRTGNVADAGWEQIPMPEGCEIVTVGEGLTHLSKTIYGKIELLPR